MFRFAFILTIGILSQISTAHAEDPRLLGTYGNWLAYTFTENGGKVCYMASQPTSAKGNYSNRGDIFALVTHRPDENKKNVFSYITGYTYQQDSEVQVQIGSKKFTLFTQDEIAWTPDDVTDNALAEAIRSGSSMVVSGTSSRGTQTKDTFSLKGSGSAHDAINKECGV